MEQQIQKRQIDHANNNSKIIWNLQLHSNYPITKIPIQSISWQKLKGKIPQSPQYFAHIFWNIDYNYSFSQENQLEPCRKFKPTVSARAYIGNKSWHREQKVTDKLLSHEYGHYLIGCLCALKFQERVNSADETIFTSKPQAVKFCQQKFTSTLKEYLEIEKNYDIETNHFYNEEEQAKWQQWIVKEINTMSKYPRESSKYVKMRRNSQSISSIKTVDSPSGSQQNKSRYLKGRSRPGSKSKEGREKQTDIKNAIQANHANGKIGKLPPLPKPVSLKEI